MRRSGSREGGTAVTLRGADNGGVTASQEPLPPITPEQLALLRQRYGAERRPSIVLILVMAGLATIFVGWVLWAALAQADRPVRWRTVGYSDLSDTSVMVKFDVFKPADRSVSCVVRALDVSGTEVGRATVAVTAAQPDVHVVYALPVTRRPTTAEVTDCRLDRPIT